MTSNSGHMKVRDISRVRMGYAFRKRLLHESNGEIRIIQAKNITSDGLLLFGKNEPLRMDISISNPLQANDVLLVNRGRFAACVFKHNADTIYAAPASILIMTLRDASILPEYLALYFNSSAGQKHLKRHLEKTTIPFISTRNLANISLPVPPLDQQQKLIDFEQTIKEYRHLSNRKSELLQQLLNNELNASTPEHCSENNNGKTVI